MRGERGQVTLFFAVGVVLLFIVGLIYLVLNVSDEPQPRDTNVGVLSTFLASCLDTVVREHLLELGATGGMLDFTGYPSAVVDEQQVLYGITRNTGAGGIVPRAYPPPQYPDDGITIELSTHDTTGNRFLDFSDGYFGDVWFPAICSKTGTNAPLSTFACEYYEGNPPGTTGPSTQELLEEEIRDGMKGCADFRAFEEAIGQEVEKVDDPEVNVTFTFTNMLVTLTYPVLLKGDATTRLEVFHRDYPVRYLPIAKFAMELARAESRNVTFDIENDYEDLESYESGFTVQRVPDVTFSGETPEIEPGSHASMITIIDSKSTLGGVSYKFSFLVEHRLPMLDHVPGDKWQDFRDGTNIGVFAVDPDDGVLPSASVTYCRNEPACGGVTRILVTDRDGDSDWQE